MSTFVGSRESYLRRAKRRNYAESTDEGDCTSRRPEEKPAEEDRQDVVTETNESESPFPYAETENHASRSSLEKIGPSHRAEKSERPHSSRENEEKNNRLEQPNPHDWILMSDSSMAAAVIKRASSQLTNTTALKNRKTWQRAFCFQDETASTKVVFPLYHTAATEGVVFRRNNRGLTHHKALLGFVCVNGDSITFLRGDFSKFRTAQANMYRVLGVQIDVNTFEFSLTNMTNTTHQDSVAHKHFSRRPVPDAIQERLTKSAGEGWSLAVDKWSGTKHRGGGLSTVARRAKRPAEDLGASEIKKSRRSSPQMMDNDRFERDTDRKSPFGATGAITGSREELSGVSVTSELTGVPRNSRSGRHSRALNSGSRLSSLAARWGSKWDDRTAVNDAQTPQKPVKLIFRMSKSKSLETVKQDDEEGQEPMNSKDENGQEPLVDRPGIESPAIISSPRADLSSNDALSSTHRQEPDTDTAMVGRLDPDLTISSQEPPFASLDDMLNNSDVSSDAEQSSLTLTLQADESLESYRHGFSPGSYPINDEAPSTAMENPADAFSFVDDCWPPDFSVQAFQLPSSPRGIDTEGEEGYLAWPFRYENESANGQGFNENFALSTNTETDGRAGVADCMISSLRQGYDPAWSAALTIEENELLDSL